MTHQLDDAVGEPRAVASDAASAAPASTVDRTEALRLWGEARRLHRVATKVHDHRSTGGIESAILAHRSLVLLLRLLIRLHGDPVPDAFAVLVDRAAAIAKTESLFPDDLGPDLMIIDEIRQRFIDGAAVTAAEERRYDRAFIRSSQWLPAVRAYLDQRLTAPPSSVRPRLVAGATALLTFAVGFIAGRQIHHETPAVPARAAAPGASGVAAFGTRGFSATYYNDATLGHVALTRIDPSIAFEWESTSPADEIPPDHFSARWDAPLVIKTAGKYTFYLTSDDGSRLYIDGKLALDNWGNHIEIMKTAEVELDVGEHPLRVEYYDNIGAALVKLEWSSERFTQTVLTAGNLR